MSPFSAYLFPVPRFQYPPQGHPNHPQIISGPPPRAQLEIATPGSFPRIGNLCTELHPRLVSTRLTTDENHLLILLPRITYYIYITYQVAAIINPLPTNDASMRHDLSELSISLWEFIWGGLILSAILQYMVSAYFSCFLWLIKG